MLLRSFSRLPGISVESIKYLGSESSDAIVYTDSNLIKNAQQPYLLYEN